MNTRQTLSVVISAYNEEIKIKDCLESVAWADEIILIDSASTDKTAGIAKKYTKHIYTRSNNPMLNINKNFGFEKATGDFILSLDADERVTPELKEEINKMLENDNKDISGYWIPRKNIIFGKWIKHTGWYPDYQLRLFRKGHGKFAAVHVHEMITLQGESMKLVHPLLHLNYESVAQFLRKTSVLYAPNEADALLQNGYSFDWRDAIRFPVKEFLSRYFAREGFKDGLHGLILSLLMAFYHLIVFANIWEKQGFKEVSDAKILSATEEEMKSAHMQLMHWFRHEKLKTIHNPVKKLFHKVIR